jgi:hypothetical protein
MTELEISNELTRALDNRDDLKAKNEFVERLWTVLPDLCKAVQDNYTEEREEGVYTPDMDTVAHMIKAESGKYVKETLDVIIEKISK